MVLEVCGLREGECDGLMSFEGGSVLFRGRGKVGGEGSGVV